MNNNNTRNTRNLEIFFNFRAIVFFIRLGGAIDKEMSLFYGISTI